MKKALYIYFVDLFLAISFLLAGITGVMKMPGWFSINSQKAIVMMKIHDWSGIVLVALVGIHLIQHRKWIVVMTKRVFSRDDVKKISIIILTIVITASLALGIYSVTNNIETDTTTTQKTTIQETQVQTGGCPLGIENDKYPGDCGLYKDENNNGECDYGE